MDRKLTEQDFYDFMTLQTSSIESFGEHLNELDDTGRHGSVIRGLYDRWCMSLVEIDRELEQAAGGKIVAMVSPCGGRLDHFEIRRENEEEA